MAMTPENGSTLVLDEKRRAGIDALAASTSRTSLDVFNDAIDSYLDLDRWQHEQIAAALVEADAGDFASDEELAAAFARW